MKTILTCLALFSALVLTGPAGAQTAASAAMAGSPEAVTVVIQINVAPGAKADAANAAMDDMRAMIRKQPGFLGEEFLRNQNPANTPTHVHVIRWAALKYWESVFTSPEFLKLNAAAQKQMTISASAFKTIK